MAINARILTQIELPEQVEIEIEDTIRGQTVVRKISFSDCLNELGELGAIDLEKIEPAELISMACALAKHRAIDQYLVSIGVDPHAHLERAEHVAHDPLGDATSPPDVEQ